MHLRHRYALQHTELEPWKCSAIMALDSSMKCPSTPPPKPPKCGSLQEKCRLDNYTLFSNLKQNKSFLVITEQHTAWKWDHRDPEIPTIGLPTSQLYHFLQHFYLTCGKVNPLPMTVLVRFLTQFPTPSKFSDTFKPDDRNNSIFLISSGNSCKVPMS